MLAGSGDMRVNNLTPQDLRKHGISDVRISFANPSYDALLGKNNHGRGRKAVGVLTNTGAVAVCRGIILPVVRLRINYIVRDDTTRTLGP